MFFYCSTFTVLTTKMLKSLKAWHLDVTRPWQSCERVFPNFPFHTAHIPTLWSRVSTFTTHFFSLILIWEKQRLHFFWKRGFKCRFATYASELHCFYRNTISLLVVNCFAMTIFRFRVSLAVNFVRKMNNKKLFRKETEISLSNPSQEILVSFGCSIWGCSNFYYRLDVFILGLYTYQSLLVCNMLCY